MNLPSKAQYKDAKNGGKILVMEDGHEYARSKVDVKRVHYICRTRQGTTVKLQPLFSKTPIKL